MKNTIPSQSKKTYKSSIEYLHKKTLEWISEIEFIKVEQKFLKELISEHIISLCKSDNFNTAKLLLKGIDHEHNLGDELIVLIKDHNVNLALLMEHIYLKKETDFRNNHTFLKVEVENYIQNFKYIKEQVYELVLFIMKNEKQKKLLLI